MLDARLRRGQLDAVGDRLGEVGILAERRVDDDHDGLAAGLRAAPTAREQQRRDNRDREANHYSALPSTIVSTRSATAPTRRWLCSTRTSVTPEACTRRRIWASCG